MKAAAADTRQAEVIERTAFAGRPSGGSNFHSLVRKKGLANASPAKVARRWYQKSDAWELLSPYISVS